jgi:hypothetical protein
MCDCKMDHSVIGPWPSYVVEKGSVSKIYFSCTCLDMFFIVIILILLYISKQYELLKVYHMVIHSKVLSNLYHFFNKMDGRGNTRFHVLVCYKLDGNNVPANNGNTDSTSFPHHAYFVTRLPSGCRPSWLSTSTLRARRAPARLQTPPPKLHRCAMPWFQLSAGCIATDCFLLNIFLGHH